MKSFSRFMKMSALSVLAVCGLVSCSEDGKETVSADLRLVPDKTVIEPNGFDAVSFTVEYDGIDVTDESSVYMEAGTPAGFTFTTDAEGSYGFYAEYKGERSETVTIVATSTMPEIPEDPEPENTAFSRKVLLLQFTGTGCSFCPYVLSALKELEASPVRTQFVKVACHSYNPDDKAYYSGPLADVLNEEKQYPYVTYDLDKDLYTENNLSSQYLFSQFRSNIISETTNRPALAGIAASSALIGGNVVVSMSVKVSETGEYKVAAWLVEDGIYDEQANPNQVPGDFDTHNDCLRYAQYTGSGKSADYTGVSLGTVSAGEEAGYTFSIPVEEGWNAENCHLVLLVTAEDGNAFYVNNVAACEIGGTVEYEYE